ncbi:urea transporter [Motiliproteus sp.]|uniref:urea transporter n=1 Tax=Motiliproteus sp. TaxID=1898955 RepID=UPI003BAA39AD
MKTWWVALLRGFGQLLFMPHAGAGALVLLGILINSPLMLAGALVGGIGATLAGRWTMPVNEFNQGLSGFNGVLLGLAATLLMQPSLLLWCLVFFGGAVTAWCFNWGMRRHWQLLTAPYIGLMLLIWVALPNLPAADGGWQLHWSDGYVISGVLTGVGQMGFQGSLVSALCMLTGLWLGGGWRAVFWALLGSLIGALSGYAVGTQQFALAIGLAGYNSALIAVALGIVSGHHWRSWQLWLGISAATALALTGLKMALFPILTLPFVLAMWLVIGVERLKLKA